MSQPHPRHLRIIQVPAGRGRTGRGGRPTDNADKPWIVQSCAPGADQAHQWRDILAFADQAEAARYVEEIAARDQLLLDNKYR